MALAAPLTKWRPVLTCEIDGCINLLAIDLRLLGLFQPIGMDLGVF